MSDAALYDLRERISALALKHRLPTIAYVPEFTDVGALMSYGPPRRAMYRRSAGRRHMYRSFGIRVGGLSAP